MKPLDAKNGKIYLDWATSGESAVSRTAVMESDLTTDHSDIAIAFRRTYAEYTMQVVKSKKAPKKRPGNARLSPKELRRLADRLVAAKDPAEVSQLKDELERGFYGDLEHA